MLDINFIRQNKEKIRQSTKDKGYNPDVVDNVLKLDEDRKKLIGEVEKLREERNRLTDSIKYQASSIKTNSKSKKEEIEKLKKPIQEIKKKLDDVEPQLRRVEENFSELLLRIPNPAFPDVKVGKDETENEVIRKWGEPAKFNFKPKDHLEIGESLNIIDVKRAAKVSGARFAYLTGGAVLLELSLVQFAFDFLVKEGFIPVIPPFLIRKKSMKGMGYMEHGGKDDMFVLDKDDLILIATSEQAIGPMHAGEVFEKKDLPRRYVGFSPCFRREAGSYGKDTRGILRLHQFDKVEMFSFTTPENGDREHEYFLSLEEKLFQALEIPYQVVKMCTGDLGVPAARKYDLEAWLPGQGKYREVTSTSTTTDFQARGLNIKYRDGNKTEYVYMLNGTAFAIGRTIIAILENYQQKDGSVKVPQVLEKYVGGKKSLSTEGRKRAKN